MKNITKHIALFLVFAFFLSALVIVPTPIEAEAAEVKTYVGDMTISRSGIAWTSGSYENQLMLVKPGSSLTGDYFGQVYAVYNSTKGGYVVTEKSALHCSYSKTVASNAVGLAISYQPLTTTGSDFARENWFVWQQIRIGDIITFSNVDVANGTVNTSGTFGNSDFVSTSKVHVTTVRDDAAATTGFTGKTIVALGDSVTAGGAWTESVEAALNTRVINASTPGARTNEGLNYFATQVAPHNPDIVFIKYAINDTAQYSIAASNLTTFKNNLRTLCDMTLEIGALPILFTTNNIQLSDSSKYSAVGGLYTFYAQFIEAIREVAAEYDTYCVDLYKNVWSGLTKANYLMDSVHPNYDGYALEASYITSFLKENEAGIIAKTNEVSGKVEGLPEAMTNYAASANGGSYMYPTTAYPGGSAYYSTAYYGDNSNQGGAYFSGKLNDAVLPADSIPNTSNTNWAVYFSGVTTPTIYFKLSDSVYLNSIKLYTRNGSASGVNYNGAVISSVSVSADGSNYTTTSAYTSKTTASGTVNTTVKLTFSEAVKTQYVCVTLATTTDRTAIGEIEIWGDTKLFGVEADPFELVDGSSHVMDDSYIDLSAEELTAEAVIGEFKCEVTIQDANGNTLASTDAVGTGAVVVQKDSAGNVIASVTVVVSGDTDGDACVTTTDYMLIKLGIISSSAFDDVYGIASDYDGDDSVTTSDLMLMRFKFMGKIG